jgi:ribulose kinase
MAAAAGRVKLRQAIDPLVLAVDIGSTASRGDVYDAAGRPVRGGREKVSHGRLHASYLTARLRWLRDTMPDTFRSVRHWMSLGEYIYLQILGVTAAGTSTAAWTGMLDRRTGQWDQELLDVCGVGEAAVRGPRSRPADHRSRRCRTPQMAGLA